MISDAPSLRESPTLRLVDRLRGIYVLPVNDGAGLLNGRSTFTREFQTPPIQHEAAAEIELLQDAVGGLLSWLGQTTPAEFVDFLRRSQPDLFGQYDAADLAAKCEAVLAAGWSSLAHPSNRNDGASQ